jgi:hypothetical protein
MTSSAALRSPAAIASRVSAVRPGRRLCAIGLLSLALVGAAAPAALADPNTMIVKPGHVSVQNT